MSATTSTYITYYSAVDMTGNVVLSRFTADSSVTLKPGFRLLPDCPDLVEFNREQEYIQRVEPVLAEHTSVNYSVIKYNVEAMAAYVRNRRNALLFESDPYMVIDLYEGYSSEYKQQLKDYRQTLRDIPEQPGFPYDVEWPMLPSEFKIIEL